jgi:DNA-directed RNA polymerase subunit RPC12/RpoP
MYRLNTDFQLFFQKKQYTCTDCDNKYCHKQSLVAHKNAAHGLREFKCKDCSSVFGYESVIYHESRCVGKNTIFSVDIAVFFLQMTHKICSISKRVSAHRANKPFSVVFASKMAL